MAYILKSNVVVNDPEGRFEFYSKYGKAPAEVAKYVKSLELAGYEVSQSEFESLRDFVNNLEQSLIWDKVREVYPIMGKDLTGASLKLKTLAGGEAMISVNGFGDSHLEKVGGRVLGKKATTPTILGNQPALDTGLKVGDLGDDVGFHFYAGGATDSGSSYWQPLIGALTSASAAGSVTQLALNITQSQLSCALNSGVRGSSDGFRPQTGVVGGSVVVNTPNISSTSIYYFDGVRTHQSAAGNIAADVDKTASLYIFGRSAQLTTNGAGTSTGYSGFVRFGCVTSGNLTDEQVSILHSEIDTLVFALGKAI